MPMSNIDYMCARMIRWRLNMKNSFSSYCHERAGSVS